MGCLNCNYIYEPQAILKLQPKYIYKNQMRRIMNQMYNCFCKIKNSDGKTGTGFFCNIVFPQNQKSLKGLITNNHVLTKEMIIIGKSLDIENEKFSKTININKERKTFTSEKYDITIIEIKSSDEIDIDYLDIDEKIFDENNKIDFKELNIYLIHYPLTRLQ